MNPQENEGGTLLMNPEPDHGNHQDPFESFSLDVSRERVETLWKQALANKSSARNELATARASRAKAELERQRISNEALEATRQACEQIMGETECQLISARHAESEAEAKLAEAENGLKEAQRVQAEADSYHERVMAEAQAEAQRICDEARSAAMEECAELKRHVTYEVQCILAEIDAIREAAREEMEAQRIYTETSNIQSMSRDIHAEIMGRVDQAMAGNGHSSEFDGRLEAMENHSPEHMEEPVEVMANGQHPDDGEPPEHMDGEGEQKSSRRSRKEK